MKFFRKAFDYPPDNGWWSVYAARVAILAGLVLVMAMLMLLCLILAVTIQEPILGVAFVVGVLGVAIFSILGLRHVR